MNQPDPKREHWPREILTARLRLTALEVDDATPLAAIADAERAHLEPWIDVPDRDTLVASIRAMAAPRDSERRQYVVRRGEAIVGCVSVAPCGRRALELAYWLRASETGDGLASEALTALCDVASAHARQLQIRCRADNVDSARVACRLGFTLADEREADGVAIQRWIADPGALPLWRGVKGVCAALGPVDVGDDGTLYVAGAALRVLAVAGEPFVLAASDIGPELAFAGSDCLRHNAKLAFGALALEADRMQLRFAGPAYGLSVAALRMFIHEAQRLRDLGRAQPDAQLSEYFIA